MARITHLKQKLSDGTMSDWIPIGADASQIQVSISSGDNVQLDPPEIMSLQEAINANKLVRAVEWVYDIETEEEEPGE